MNAGEILNSTYEIQEKIGAGGGGTIYKAYHKRLQKEVVLKKIHKSTSRNEEEKEILKNLKHSYLPQVFDFLDAEDGVFTIIDYIPGQSFEKLLKENRAFPVKKVVKYGTQLCEVVEYLHKQKPPIVHGDIKPANIMLTPEDNICLIDFNISGVLDGNSMVTAGYTPGYASPEQAEAFRISTQKRKTGGNKPEKARSNTAADTDTTVALAAEDSGATVVLAAEDSDATVVLPMENADVTEVLPAGNVAATEVLQQAASGSKTICEDISCKVDVRSDIYSIGATLYHLLTGIKPDSNPANIKKPSDINPNLGESISLILMKALSARPEDRFQTVSSMLDAFRRIHKYDFRYKKMMLKQEMTFLFAVACVAAGILGVFFGNKQIQLEKEEAYVQAVAMLSEAVSEDSDDNRIEQLYSEARQMKPVRLEAYFQKALFLYRDRDYQGCQSFIEDTILSDSVFSTQERIADVYFILGNCYFEQENYEQAVVDYRTAILRNDENPTYYRDYVIALVRGGKLDVAKEALLQAEEKGISSVDLLMVNGELKKANGAYAEAEDDFKTCIAEAEDDYLRTRAYIMCDMVYREMAAAGTGDVIENLKKSVALLEDARTKVGLENQLLIYEHLAQSYIDLEELEADKAYADKAIGVLQSVIGQGWGNYRTYHNIAILYQKMKQFDKAEEVLNRMIQLDSENYIAYKRLAFLEVERQNRKKNENRSYKDFLSYYKKAKELYATAPAAGGDPEMQLLDSLNQQLIDGGWVG